MKPLIRFKKTISLLRIALLLVCFALVPLAHGVVPAPDGGYPGFNTAEGQNALFSLTTGVGNAAVGWFSLFSNTDGSFNTALGAGTLLFNIGSQSTGDGTQNTAIGTAALLFNTTGARNTAIGTAALLSNTEGNGNTAVGREALSGNTAGGQNMAIGNNALFNNTTGNFNIANGAGALSSNTTGDSNTAIGWNALSTSVGTGNIALGAIAGENVTTASNVICIGVSGANVNNSCYIGQIYGQPGGSQAVYVNSDGKLGQMVSSRRFKDEIKQMEDASEVIYRLKPVSFRYKAEVESSRPLGFGLIAEDVEKISPDLVTREIDGTANSVRYDGVNAMLLNEFLKEHRKTQEDRATIAELKKEIASLTTRVKEQAAQIQKVSVEIELSKAAPQTVLNSQ
jgi:Chaperone of endosialidase